MQEKVPQKSYRSPKYPHTLVAQIIQFYMTHTPQEVEENPDFVMIGKKITKRLLTEIMHYNSFSRIVPFDSEVRVKFIIRKYYPQIINRLKEKPLKQVLIEYGISCRYAPLVCKPKDIFNLRYSKEMVDKILLLYKDHTNNEILLDLNLQPNDHSLTIQDLYTIISKNKHILSVNEEQRARHIIRRRYHEIKEKMKSKWLKDVLIEMGIFSKYEYIFHELHEELELKSIKNNEDSAREISKNACILIQCKSARDTLKEYHSKVEFDEEKAMNLVKQLEKFSYSLNKFFRPKIIAVTSIFLISKHKKYSLARLLHFQALMINRVINSLVIPNINNPFFDNYPEIRQKISKFQNNEKDRK
jgi:hypothetical protein